MPGTCGASRCDAPRARCSQRGTRVVTRSELSVRLLVTSAALLAAAVVFAGCGTSSPKRLSVDGYMAAIDRISQSPEARDAQKWFFQLAAGTRCGGIPFACHPLSRASCSAGAKAFAADVHQIIDDAAKLEPPKKAEDLQARFLAASRRTSAQLDRLALDTAAGRVACGQPWNHRAYGLASTKEAQGAINEFFTRFNLHQPD